MCQFNRNGRTIKIWYELAYAPVCNVHTHQYVCTPQVQPQHSYKFIQFNYTNYNFLDVWNISGCL